MASPDWPQSTAVPRLVGPACDCVLDANAALQDAAPHTHCGRGSMTHLPAGAAAAKIAGAPTKLVGATRGPIAPVVDKRRPVHGVRACPGQRISHRTLCVGQLPLLPSRARASVRQRGSARRRSDAPPGMYVPPKGCSPARTVQRRGVGLLLADFHARRPLAPPQQRLLVSTITHIRVLAPLVAVMDQVRVSETRAKAQ